MKNIYVSRKESAGLGRMLLLLFLRRNGEEDKRTAAYIVFLCAIAYAKSWRVL
jgi:hypothetical protein